MPPRGRAGRAGTPVSSCPNGSPLRLRSLDDIVNDLLNRLAAALGFGALVVVAFAAHALPLEQHPSVRLLNNLDVDGDLEPAAGADGLRGVRAHSHGHVDIVRADHTAHDGVGAILRRVTNTEA